MAKTKPTPLYETISGTLYKKKNDPCAQSIVAKHLRNSAFHNRVYLGDPSPRSTPPSPTEIERRTQFGYVAAAVKARKQDLMSITADQAAFAAASKEPGFKYHSYHGWLFGRAWKGYNPTTHEVTW